MFETVAAFYSVLLGPITKKSQQFEDNLPRENIEIIEPVGKEVY